MTSHASASELMERGLAASTSLSIDSFEALESLRGDWDALRWRVARPTPNTDFERFVATTRAMGDSVRPWVMVVGHGDGRALVVGRMSKRRVSVSLGYTRIQTLPIRCLDVVYGGVMTDGRENSHLLAAEAVLGELRSGRAQHVMLNHLPADDPVAGALLRTGKALIAEEDLHWRFAMEAGGFEKTLSRFSSKHRYNITRTDKLLVKAFGGRVEMRVFTSADEIDEFFVQTAQLAEKTYQAALGSAFADTPVWRSLLGAEAKAGRLRCHWLVCDGNPIAFQIGSIHGEVYMLESVGYLPEHTRLSPGTVLLMRSFADVLSAGARWVDYGFGDAPYKRMYGTESREEVTLHLYGRGGAALLAGAMDRSARTVAITMQGIVQQLGLVRRLKKDWRERLRIRKAASELSDCIPNQTLDTGTNARKKSGSIQEERE